LSKALKRQLYYYRLWYYYYYQNKKKEDESRSQLCLCVVEQRLSLWGPFRSIKSVRQPLCVCSHYWMFILLFFYLYHVVVGSRFFLLPWWVVGGGDPLSIGSQTPFACLGFILVVVQPLRSYCYACCVTKRS
jgi:hypothetical protein